MSIRKSLKVIFLVAFACIVLGAVLVVVSFAAGGGFRKGGNNMRDYDITSPFSSVTVQVGGTDVNIRRSSDDTAYVRAYETDGLTYDVTVDDGVLTIRERDTRPWYALIGIHFADRDLTIYLPERMYTALSYEGASGDFDSEENRISFGDVNLKSASGDISFDSSASGTVTVSTQSGDIDLSRSDAAALSCTTQSGDIDLSYGEVGTLSVSTLSGDIDLSYGEVGTLLVSTLSGEIELERVTAQTSLSIETSSGRVSFSSCDAPAVVLKSKSGDIRGSLLTGKRFDITTSSGRIDCPPSSDQGGTCRIETRSGDVRISVSSR